MKIKPKNKRIDWDKKISKKDRANLSEYVKPNETSIPANTINLEKTLDRMEIKLSKKEMRVIVFCYNSLCGDFATAKRKKKDNLYYMRCEMYYEKLKILQKLIKRMHPKSEFSGKITMPSNPKDK